MSNVSVWWQLIWPCLGGVSIATAVASFTVRAAVKSQAEATTDALKTISDSLAKQLEALNPTNVLKEAIERATKLEGEMALLKDKMRVLERGFELLQKQQLSNAVSCQRLDAVLHDRDVGLVFMPDVEKAQAALVAPTQGSRKPSTLQRFIKKTGRDE